MALYRLTAPAETPITLAEAAAHLRLDGSLSPVAYPEQDLVTGLIDAATAHLDGADGILGRALVSQQWKMTANGFPACFQIPLPPLISIDSIKYLDGDGVERTLAADQYQVTGIGGRQPAMVEPAYGVVWPTPRAVAEAVRVTFTAGYGDAEDVPASIKAAIKLLVGHWFENREAVTIGQPPAELPRAVDALLAPYRVW